MVKYIVNHFVAFLFFSAIITPGLTARALALAVVARLLTTACRHGPLLRQPGLGPTLHPFSELVDSEVFTPCPSVVFDQGQIILEILS